MKRYDVLITSRAEKQVKAIARYIAKDWANPNAASKFLDRFQEKLAYLETFPKAHPLLGEDPWKSRGVRKIMLKSFVAYYWVDAERLQVIVLAVLYARRDQLKSLAKLDFDAACFDD